MIKKANVEKVKNLLRKVASASENDMSELLEFIKNNPTTLQYDENIEAWGFPKKPSLGPVIEDRYLKFKKLLNKKLIKDYYESGEYNKYFNDEISNLKKYINENPELKKDIDYLQKAKVEDFKIYKLWHKLYNNLESRRRMESRVEKYRKAYAQWKKLYRVENPELNAVAIDKILNYLGNTGHNPGSQHIGLDLIKSGLGGAAAANAEDGIESTDEKKTLNVLMKAIDRNFKHNERNIDKYTDGTLKAEDANAKIKDYLNKALNIKPSKSLLKKLDDDYGKEKTSYNTVGSLDDVDIKNFLNSISK